jgi:hypothetical protein
MNEQRRAILDEYVNGEAVAIFTQQVLDRLADVRTITDPKQRSEATDQLVDDLPDMLRDVDVFDRVNVAQISGQLKNIYDQDMGFAAMNKSIMNDANRRAFTLMEMRRDVNEANKMFGVMELATRQYVTPLVPTPQEAELLRTAGNLDEVDYVVMEHFGDGWESFLELNRPLDEWQEYITAYYDQIMSKLHPLSDIPGAPQPQAPVSMPDQIPSPVIITKERSIAVPSAINMGTGGANDYLVTSTGLQSRFENAPLGGVVAAPDVRTGDRDARRRSLTVPANLNGLAQWVEATYRTQGDIVQVTKSPEGGVISLIITGDVSHWTRCLDSMRIPVPLLRSVDDNNNTLTVSYV